jgi:nicotinate phosphoribosyltransferase
VTNDDGKFLPTMKLSRGKVTYPGRKQVFRVQNKRGKFIKDILGLEAEKIKGEPLLKKAVRKGEIIYRLPSLEQIRSFSKENLSRLPGNLKEVYPKYTYPVIISPQLKRLRQSLAHKLEERQ